MVDGMTGGVPQAVLVSLQRSAAMLQPGAVLPIEREVVIDVIAELIEQRQLLARLGGDIRAVVARSPRLVT